MGPIKQTELPLNLILKASSEKRDALLERSRQLLMQASDLFASASENGLTVDADFRPLLQQLEEPFSVFVCGEFNSGKSSILNALAGENLAATGVLPTTKKIELLNSLKVEGLTFIDSPGLNSIIEGHQEATENYLQRSDVILFVTSVERALTESEVTFLNIVKNTWARKVILVLNKIDLISPDDRKAVAGFVRQGLQQIVGLESDPILVSARSGEGIEELRRQLAVMLGAKEQFQLKLRGPQASLIHFISQLKRESQNDRISAEQELVVLQRVVSRASERLKEGREFVVLITKQIDGLMQEIVSQIGSLIDERFGFADLLKSRLLGHEGTLQNTLESIMQRLDVEKRITSLIDEIASALQRYSDTVVRESSEEFKLASMLSGAGFTFPEISHQPVDLRALGDDLKISGQKGLQNSLALGGAAAATGIGVKIATAGALLDFSGIFLTLSLALLSLKALPRERKKAKAKVEKAFKESGAELRTVLNEAVESKISAVREKIGDALAPAIQKVETKIGYDRELLASLMAVEQQSRTLLDAIGAV